MKPVHFIPPALAILGSAYWLSSQNQTITEISEKTRVIKERIVVFDKAVANTPKVVLGQKDSDKPDEFTLEDGSVDWSKIAKLMSESQGANGSGIPSDIKAMLKLQKKMMELTEAELIDGLSVIPNLEMPDEVAAMIKQGLLQRLSETDPLAALNGMGEITAKKNRSLFWAQKGILTKLSKEDPTAAAKWLDDQIAAGKVVSSTLDMNNDIRLELESALLEGLISSDLNAVKSRLQNYEPEQIQHLLTSTNVSMKDAGAEFSDLAREYLSPEQASDTITDLWGRTRYADLSKASEDLGSARLNETEKSEVVKKIARRYSHSSESDTKFNDMYEWAKDEAPGTEAEIVGDALTSSFEFEPADIEQNFEKALELASSQNDPEITNYFIQTITDQGRGESALAKFKNPKLAEQFRALQANLPQPATDSE